MGKEVFAELPEADVARQAKTCGVPLDDALRNQAGIQSLSERQENCLRGFSTASREPSIVSRISQTFNEAVNNVAEAIGNTLASTPAPRGGTRGIRAADSVIREHGL